MNDPRIEAFECYAWVSEDELGSGVVGIKRGLTPAGDIPLVSVDAWKLQHPDLIEGGQRIVDQFGKTRYLIRLVCVEVVRRIEPRT
jgi:hypothetical protein